MAPAGDAGAPFRLVARADLDELVGGFQPRGERAPGRPPRHPVTATALLFDPGGETLHVACAGAEVCVAHCRVAQGTTPSGDVRSRFVVDDVTPSPRPPASPHTSAASSRPEPTSRVQVVDRTIRELCAVRSARAVAARADAGVEVHYYDDRSSSDARTNGASFSVTTNDANRPTRRVFVIPDTANATAIASDAFSHQTASRVAVASPGGRKRVVVYEVPPYWDLVGKENNKGNHVVFDIAYDIVLGLAHPVQTMAWLGATLVIGAPRGAVFVRVATGMAEPLVLNFSGKRDAVRRDKSSRARNAALAALAPKRPSPDGASYDTMFGSERSRRVKEDTKETEETAAAAPALAVSFSFDSFSFRRSDAEPTPDGSVVARAPDGTLLRVWLPGADEDVEDEEEDEGVEDEEDDLDAFSNADKGARVLILDDAFTSFFARSERLDVTCAFPFAVAAPVTGGAARAVDLTGLAPGDSHALALGVSGDGAAKDRDSRANESRLLIAGAPGGAALGRGDDEKNDERFFSCPASASSLLAARGGVLELHRARSTRERVVELAVAGRLEEAVALADARGADVDANDEPSGFPTVSGKTPTKKTPFAVAARAECGFLAASLRLDFALAVSLWRSAGSALSLSELLPYFPRQGGSKTSFRGGVEASAVGAGAENDAARFVSRLGAREIASTKRDVKTPFVADLETVVSSHSSQPTPIKIEVICRDAKSHFASLFASRPALHGDPRKRRLDTLTLRLWAETGDAGALERALAGSESNEKANASKESHTSEHTVGERDVDVSVLGPALTASGRHFARALSYWRLEKDDDAAFETYASLAFGELVEAPCEPSRGGAAASFGSSTLAAARLASCLFRERCREDLRGAARPDDEAVARWTRRHLVWILRHSPEDGVAVLATPRVKRAAEFPFVLESLVSANASRATRVSVLRDRIAPFAPDRANGDAHTAFFVALWELKEEEVKVRDAEVSDELNDASRISDARREPSLETTTTLVSGKDEVSDEESLVSFLRREPSRVDARAALAALDPNAVTSSSVRGMLALGLVTGVRVAPPAIPKALARHAFALAELRGAVGDHVAAYRLLLEVARDADAAEAHVVRFGEEARRARDRVLELANRPPRLEDPTPRFSLRGKV